MDFILIDVLHTLNPHLVLSQQTEQVSASKSKLEVIGLYGIVPAGMVLEIDGRSSKFRRLTAWTPGATKVLKEAFLDAENIMFIPAFIVKRTTIFDTEVHKYGEIIVTQSDGKTKQLSEILTNAKLAVYDKERFHNRLETGKLENNIKNDEIEDVLKAIDKYKSKKEAQKQYQVYKQAQKEFQENEQAEKETEQYEQAIFCAQQEKVEYHVTPKKDSALTVENLNLHNKYDGKENQKHLFYGIDEQSLGRANSRQKSKTDTRSLLQKRLDLIMKGLPHVPVKKTLITDEQTKFTSKKCDESLRTGDKPIITEMTPTKCGAPLHPKAPATPKNYLPSKELNLTRSASGMRNVPIVEVQKEEKSPENPNRQTVICDYKGDVQQNKNRKKSPKVSTSNTQNYDPKKEQRVAYGPPGINRSLLVAKVVPIKMYEKMHDTPPLDDNDLNEAIPENLQRSDFGEVDSNVGLDISLFR